MGTLIGVFSFLSMLLNPLSSPTECVHYSVDEWLGWREKETICSRFLLRRHVQRIYVRLFGRILWNQSEKLDVSEQKAKRNQSKNFLSLSLYITLLSLISLILLVHHCLLCPAHPRDHNLTRGNNWTGQLAHGSITLYTSYTGLPHLKFYPIN